ncbi:hypothetical protein Q7P37_002649 [Cladosporium fusiforme]
MAHISADNKMPAGRTITLDREGIDNLFAYLREREALERLIEKDHQEAQRVQDLLKERLEEENSDEIPWVAVDRCEVRYSHPSKDSSSSQRDAENAAKPQDSSPPKVVAVVGDDQSKAFWTMEQVYDFRHDRTTEWAIGQLYFRHPLLFFLRSWRA